MHNVIYIQITINVKNKLMFQVCNTDCEKYLQSIAKLILHYGLLLTPYVHFEKIVLRLCC